MHTDREREEEKVKRFARIAATYIEILWKPRMRERKDSSLIRAKALIKDYTARDREFDRGEEKITNRIVSKIATRLTIWRATRFVK